MFRRILVLLLTIIWFPFGVPAALLTHVIAVVCIFVWVFTGKDENVLIDYITYPIKIYIEVTTKISEICKENQN